MNTLAQFLIGGLYYIALFFVGLALLHLILRIYVFHVSTTHREEAAAAIRDGEEQLQILKRQVVLGQLYPSSRSVME